MAISILPARLLVEPRIENWIDDSDPHYDFRAGYTIKYKDAEGWHAMYDGSSESVAAWLAEHGYNQVSCTMRRHKLAGRYEPGQPSYTAEEIRHAIELQETGITNITELVMRNLEEGKE